MPLEGLNNKNLKNTQSGIERIKWNDIRQAPQKKKKSLEIQGHIKL